MDAVLCAANASSMQFYFNEERYGILPEEIKKELKVICVLYCADVGGIINFSFNSAHSLEITTMQPIDEIGAELKVRQIQREHAELFEKLEAFDRQYAALRDGKNVKENDEQNNR